jgi:hypothetical protein
MFMPMVRVMFVLVFVIDRLVRMRVDMVLCKVEPDAAGHEQRSSGQPPRERFIE